MQGLPFVLPHPAAATWIDTFEAAGVSLVITGWVNQNETSVVLAKGEAIRQAKLALSAAEVGLTDSSQVVILDRATKEARGAAHPAEIAAVEVVSPETDHDLDKIIDAEREAKSREDLLRDDALKE